MLALACSADAFALGFAYGGKRIRIPIVSGLVISLCCTAFLGGALLLGDFLRLPGWLSPVILSAIGVYKFFEKSEPKDGDMNKDQIISLAEAVLLSMALSLDGMAVGFGAGVGDVNIPAAVTASAVIGGAAIFGGCRLGGKLSKSLPFHPAKIGGALLIGLAVLELL
jgi:putative Mn2+ efflux pump MntP